MKYFISVIIVVFNYQGCTPGTESNPDPEGEIRSVDVVYNITARGIVVDYYTDSLIVAASVTLYAQTYFPAASIELGSTQTDDSGSYEINYTGKILPEVPERYPLLGVGVERVNPLTGKFQSGGTVDQYELTNDSVYVFQDSIRLKD